MARCKNGVGRSVGRGQGLLCPSRYIVGHPVKSKWSWQHGGEGEGTRGEARVAMQWCSLDVIKG